MTVLGVGPDGKRRKRFLKDKTRAESYLNEHVRLSVDPLHGRRHEVMFSLERLDHVGISKIYPLYVAKAEKKGRSQAEVDQIICWPTGCTPRQLQAQLQQGKDCATFLTEAPKPNPARILITGVVCGVRVEAIADSTMRELRRLDKLVDELAKGRAMEQIRPQPANTPPPLPTP